MPAAMQANGLAPEEPASRTVEVEAFCSWSACRTKMRSIARLKHRVDLVFLARHREHHVEEVRGVIELVPRIDEGLADGIFIGHRGDGRHLRDHAERGNVALDWIGDVDGVVIEGGKRADGANHDGHRMRVAPETGKEPVHLLVRHRVVGDAVLEVEILLLAGQVAVQQDMAGFEEIAVLGELLDGIAAIEQNALVAVDKGDVGFARRRRGEAGVVGEVRRTGRKAWIYLEHPARACPRYTGSSYCLLCSVSVAVPVGFAASGLCVVLGSMELMLFS